MAAEPNAGASSVTEPHEAVIGVEKASAVSVVPDDLHALRAVVAGTAGGTGQEFFRSLVRHLAEAIDVHYAGVCEFKGPQLGRVLALWDPTMSWRDWTLASPPARPPKSSAAAWRISPPACRSAFPGTPSWPSAASRVTW